MVATVKCPYKLYPSTAPVAVHWALKSSCVRSGSVRNLNDSLNIIQILIQTISRN